MASLSLWKLHCQTSHHISIPRPSLLTSFDRNSQRTSCCVLKCSAMKNDETTNDHCGKSAQTDSFLTSFPYRAISVLSTAGLIETGYLTFTKLSGGDVACPLSGGCASVLTSSFSDLWGIVPLSALGMLAYGAVSVLSMSKILKPDYKLKNAISVTDDSTRTAVLAGGLLLGTTSAYLMYVLYRYFPGEICPWCIGSAGISFSIAALAVAGLRPREREEAIAPGCGLIAATFIFLSSGLGNPDASLARSTITELPYRQPEIAEESPNEAIDLARELKNAGAKMYGAFWCSHCYEQKQMFGREAMKDFPYVECFPEGWKQGIEMASECQAVDGLKGFPTWVIDGNKLEGVQSFETLKDRLQTSDAGK